MIYSVKPLKQCLTIVSTQYMKVSIVFAVTDNVTSAIIIIIFYWGWLRSDCLQAET